MTSPVLPTPGFVVFEPPRDAPTQKGRLPKKAAFPPSLAIGRRAVSLQLRADQPREHKDCDYGAVDMDVTRADHYGLWHNLPRREQVLWHP